MTSDNFAWLHRGVSEIFPSQSDSEDQSENLEQLCNKIDRPLRVKLGIDPTGTDLRKGILCPKCKSVPVGSIPNFTLKGRSIC